MTRRYSFAGPDAVTDRHGARRIPNWPLAGLVCPTGLRVVARFAGPPAGPDVLVRTRDGSAARADVHVRPGDPISRTFFTPIVGKARMKQLLRPYTRVAPDGFITFFQVPQLRDTGADALLQADEGFEVALICHGGDVGDPAAPQALQVLSCFRKADQEWVEPRDAAAVRAPRPPTPSASPPSRVTGTVGKPVIVTIWQRRMSEVDEIVSVAVCTGMTTEGISAHFAQSFGRRCRRRRSAGP